MSRTSNAMNQPPPILSYEELNKLDLKNIDNLNLLHNKASSDEKKLIINKNILPIDLKRYTYYKKIDARKNEIKFILIT